MKKTPLVTYILLSYNQENYIESAVLSALEQDYSNLEIIISDDCSTDNTYEIISNIFKNIKDSSYEINIHINRNTSNMGFIPHFNKLISMSKGEFIVVNAGDDICVKTRTSDAIDVFKNNPDIMHLSFIDDEIDENGKVIFCHENLDGKIVKFNLGDFILRKKKYKISGASRVYRSEIFKIYPPLLDSTPTEDTTTFFRGILIGDAAILNKKGILYRRHSSSLSAEKNLMKMDINRIIKQYYTDAMFAFKNGHIRISDLYIALLWIFSITFKRNFRKIIFLLKNMFSRFR